MPWSLVGVKGLKGFKELKHGQYFFTCFPDFWGTLQSSSRVKYDGKEAKKHCKSHHRDQIMENFDTVKTFAPVLSCIIHL